MFVKLERYHEKVVFLQVVQSVGYVPFDPGAVDQDAPQVVV